MNDPDQALAWPSGMGDDLPERLHAYEDAADADERSVDHAPGLISLGFIGAALRRGMRLWCALAVVGLVIGAGLYVKGQSTHKATTAVLLADNPNQDPASEAQTDMVLAGSTAVAAAVIQQLGLQQTPSSFQGSYTVTVVTNQVLQITASAPTSDEAVRRAAAVATQFLKFRAQYTQTQQQQQAAQLDQQVSQAQQNVDSISNQIKQVSAEPNSPQQQAQLSGLGAQRQAAVTALAQVRQYVTTTLASTQTTTRSMIQGSEVLDTATAQKKSLVKGAGLYAIGGLFGGLALGMAIVIIGGITSDRLRRRDDIAYAFGAPVRLSVGTLRRRRWVPDLPGRASARQRDMERVVEHLRHAVPGSSRGPVGLAVVAVDDAPTVALAVADLAVSSAKQRKRVVLADLSAGAHAARLLRARIPGIGTVSPEGVQVVVVVPAADDVAPVGPLRSQASAEGYAQADESLASACANADIVLTLATLDPAFGADHLATWATDTVAFVTAGRSTAVRIRAVGDMIRLGGTRLGSVVVLEADKSDESLGATSAAYQPV